MSAADRTKLGIELIFMCTMHPATDSDGTQLCVMMETRQSCQAVLKY